MKGKVYIIPVLVVLIVHVATQSMEAPGRVNDKAFLEASSKGDKAQIISLLDSCSNIDTTDKVGRQPIHWAAFHGHTATVELLFDLGATGIDAADEEGTRPIHCAVAYLDNGYGRTASGPRG